MKQFEREQYSENAEREEEAIRKLREERESLEERKQIWLPNHEHEHEQKISSRTRFRAGSSRVRE